MSTLIAISTLFAVLFAKDPSIGLGGTSTDWSTTLATLQTKKSLWMANGVTDYVFKQSQSCYCLGCGQADKYIVIQDKSSSTDGNPVYVEFGEKSGCEVEYPLDESYFNVSWHYDTAIAFVQQRIDSGCDEKGNSSDPFISCGGGVTFTYDETLYYPTSIFIESNSCGMACDAFMGYNIGCLSVIGSDSEVSLTYTNGCDNFTVPEIPVVGMTMFFHSFSIHGHSK